MYHNGVEKAVHNAYVGLSKLLTGKNTQNFIHHKMVAM